MKDWHWIFTLSGITLLLTILSVWKQFQDGAGSQQAAAAASPFNVSTTGSTFNFGGAGGGGNLASYVAPSGRSSSCGCGGSSGDFAIPAVSTDYANAIRLIPDAPQPKTSNDPTLPRMLLN